MTSKAKQDYYARYKSTNKWKSNREAKLLRQLKLQPGNAEQINAAIGNIEYRRKTPNSSMWSSSKRRMAQLLKEFSGSAKHECFSSNAKVSEVAIQTTWRKHDNGTVPQGKVDFSLAARLQGNK